MCNDPRTNFNGHIESASDKYPVGSIVTFHCSSNLTLRGVRMSKCQLNGSWTPRIPKCESLLIDFYTPSTVFHRSIEPVPCSIPSLPPNGRYLNHQSFGQFMNDGSRLVYICGNSRHRRRIICHKGKILPRLPKCFSGKINQTQLTQNRQCTFFLGCRVQNGSVLFSKNFYRHREKVSFTCKKNSVPLVNNETIHCFNGNLSVQPICQQTLTTCSVPHTLFLRNIINTTIPSGASMEIGSSFSYQCIPDYQPLNDSGIVQCLEDGKLSHHAYCVPISCQEYPPSINNGRPIFRSTAHGSIARYRCYPGYRLEKNNLAKVTCQFGLWLPKQPPRCLPSNGNF